jgi:MFS family permease
MLNQDRKGALESNIWKYTLILITNKRIFVPILGAYYMTVPGVDAAVVGLIIFISSLSGFIFEVPSGYLSDKFGHKQTLVLARVLMILSSLFFIFSSNVPLLILGGVFMSLSHAFQSGTGSAFMHETLEELDRDNEYTKVMGKASSIGFAVPIILTVLVPFLVSFSFKLPFVVALIIDVIGLLVAVSLVKPNTRQHHIEEISSTNFIQVMKEGHRLSFFRHALFLGFVSGILLGVSSFRAIYQEFLGIPIIWFGVLFGLGRSLASLMLFYSGKIRLVLKDLKTFYLFQLVAYTTLFLITGLVDIWWVVALVFIITNGLTWGLSQVSGGYLLDIIKTSKFKATLLSSKSLIEELVGAISGLGIGLLFSVVSYQYGYFLVGVLFFIILFPLYLFIVRGEGR